jgi:hypothetical protein
MTSTQILVSMEFRGRGEAELSTDLEMHMEIKTLRTCMMTLLPAAATFLLVQACGGSSDAVAQSASAAPDPIEGVWESVVTVRNCATGAPVATFRGAQVFHRGGTFTDTNAGAPTARGPGFGIWTRNGDTYVATFRFYTFNADGSLAGTTRATRTQTISADGQTVNSTNNGEVRGVDGSLLATTCATDVSTKFR